MAYRLNPRSTASALATLFFASVCLLGACGGRSRTIIDEGDDSPVAGAGSAGAPSTGRAGAASGGAVASGGANSSQAGSGPQCNNVKCGLPACPAGSKPVTLTGTCCPVCQSACAPDQGCLAIGCGPGTHAETPPGACCPVCVDDPGLTCEEGMKGYASSASSCSTNTNSAASAMPTAWFWHPSTCAKTAVSTQRCGLARPASSPTTCPTTRT